MVKESCFCLEEMNDSDFRESFLKKESYAGSMATNNSPCSGRTLMNVTMELRKKIFSLRDILDLPPCDGSASLNKLVMGLLEDLKNLYPEINTHSKEFSDMNEASMEQGLACLCIALKSIGDSWIANEECLDKLGYDFITSLKENIDSHKLVETAAKSLDFMINMAREKFDMMDEDDQIKGYSSSRTNSFGKILSGSYSDGNSSCCSSPVTPTSVLPESARVDSSEVKEIAYFSYSPPLLLSLRIQAVKKLNPIDVKHLRHHFSHKDTESVEEPKQERKAKIRSFERTQGIIREEGTDSNTEKGTGVLENPNASEKMLDGIHSTDATDMLLLPPPLLQPSLPNVAAPPPPPPMQLRQKQFPNRAPVAAPPPPPPPPPKKSGTVLKTAQPPPPPSVPSKGPMPPPPPPMLLGSRGAPPPPPPASAARSLRPKKANTKLKRSSQMGNLYRTLKGKVEGTNLDGKSSFGKRSGVGSSTAGGRQGMADALAEMTKRSAYFQQIDEDVQKYAKSIAEMKSAISSFQTKDIDELLKFHKDVESILENLTDETQVLSRFEGFPTKKLETLRTAAALYKKLNNIITELQTWKIEGPIGQLLDKAERHFNKIKGDLDALERTKDEESKKFQSHNIHFDFNILVRIKEAMVDVSSSCMEFALKEKREAKAAEEQTQESRTGTRTEGQKKGCGKMLWRAFQLAFRVYTFAGGHDDRADELTRELAKEIESDPHHH